MMARRPGRLGLGRAAAQLLLCCLLLAAHLRSSTCYPELFVDNGFANGCTSHPTKPLGAHGAPVPDTTTTFALTAPGGGAPAKTLCPGVTYDLVVGYGASEKRRTLLTSSVGKLGSPGGLTEDPKCPNRAASSGKGTPTYTNTLTIPCDAKAPSVQLKVSSAGKKTDKFHTAATTLPLSPASDCPGSTCPGAPPPAAAAAAAAAGGDASAGASKGAAAAAVKSGGKGGAGGGCPASPFGYACSAPLDAGATLHYTLSPDPTPPDNACTAAASAAGTAASSSVQQQQQYLHLLLESPLGGYSGLSFPEARGKMFPADAVIGYADDATGKPVVGAYHLTDYAPAAAPGSNAGLGWASRMGAAQAPPPATGGSNGAKNLLCFSRPLDAPEASVSKQLDPKALKLNWVADRGTDLSRTHTMAGDLSLNAADGTSSAAALGGGGAAAARLARQNAHGALMLVAFAALMPAGALMARHKWLFGDKASGGIRAGWFHLHRLLQVVAVAVGVAGFILACVCFTVPWTNMGAPGAAPHPVYNAHRVLGVIAIALSVLQVLAGLGRPGLNHKLRRLWRMGHQSAGWLTVAVGLAAVFLGCRLMHDMADAPYVAWLLPVLLAVGLLAAAGLLAEVLKFKLQRAGSYQPHTHSFTHMSPEDQAAAAAAAAKQRQHNGGSNGAAAADLPRGNSHSHVV